MPAKAAAILGRHLNGTANVGFAHFIAQRILAAKDRQDRLSRPIVRIAVLGIVIGMAVMIITVAISTGFQYEVRNKLVGVGGHLQINSMQQTDAKETPRIAINQPFYPYLDTLPGIAHIQVYATKPGIIETANEIEGVVVKGVGSDHDWSFLRSNLVEGTVPMIRANGQDSIAKNNGRTNDLLLSRWMSERLGIGVGDTITVYLVKGREDIRPRKFIVCGIYQTGLEQLDQQVVFIDIAHLQRFSGWGLQAEILVNDSVANGRVRVEGMAFGGDKSYTYDWPGTALEGAGPHWIDLSPPMDGSVDQLLRRDTTLTLVVHDDAGTLPDTAWVRLTPDSSHFWTDSRGSHVEVAHITVARGGSGGSHRLYTGGFEVALERYEDLMAMDDAIYRDHLGYGLRTISVRQRFPEMFAWLDLLDTNVWVVIVLMTIVAIINMTSALIIIILERTTMIGVLKSLGSTNGNIRRIFLIDAAYILGIGILLGDLLGVGLCLLQRWTGLVTLNMDVYYVHAVPVSLDPMPILALNIGVLLVCMAALILPSMLVTRIAPVRAIRYA
ncbi:MAG: FtsX-like permease family protein [Flavobacteriales bacterium]